MRLHASILLVVLSASLLGGCGPDTHEPASGATSGGETEAAALARARAHPASVPPERPLYPEKSPPPLPEPSAPERAPGDAVSSEAALEAPPERVVAPREPPAPREEVPPPAPEPAYVWAPGYWYWYGGNYVWIGGAWLPPRLGYTYVSSGWVHSDGAWVFWPGGWASIGTSVVVYPVHRHHYLYYRPGHSHRYYPDTYRSYRPSRSSYPTRSSRGGTTRAVMRRR